MNWQDELRELDSALAGGELSANEYRKRRDEILAAASSPQPRAPLAGEPAGPRPAAGTDDGSDGEVTQVVGTADTTQVITSEQRSQTLTETPPAPPAGPPAGPAPSWTTHRPEPRRPGSAFPEPPAPVAPPAGAINPLEAQDLFATARPPRGSGRASPALVVIVAVVVLAVVGGAVWYIGFSGEEPADTADRQAAAPAHVDIAGIALPGTQVRNTGDMDVAEARRLQVLSEAESTLLEKASITRVGYTGTADGDYRYLLYSYPAADPDAAAAATDHVDDIQQQIGLRPGDAGDAPDGVRVSTITNDRAAALRALYTSGDATIQLCVLQVPTGDAGQLRQRFDKALDIVAEAAPPAS